jgi:16S rRNA (guanine527-N7)-methyltransferase
MRGGERNPQLFPECSGHRVQERLSIYADLLRRWQKKINLVGPSTLDDLWVRHFDDSAQLLPLAGDWTNWVDIGSGAGFPGMVVAIIAGSPEKSVSLIESDKRKAAFLREVSRETHAAASVHVGRIEAVLPELVAQCHIDVVSARALAPMSRLIDFSRPVLDCGGIGLFLKGKGLLGELTELSGDASLKLTLIDSRTEADAKVVVVRNAESSANSE